MKKLEALLCAICAVVGDDEVGRMDGDSTKMRLADLSGREGTGLRLRFSVVGAR